MPGRFALFAPDWGWWCGLEPTTGQDLWSGTLADACILGDETSALANATAIGERVDAAIVWVYLLYSAPRRLVGGN